MKSVSSQPVPVNDWAFILPSRPPLSVFAQVDDLIEKRCPVGHTDDAQGYYVAMNSAAVTEILRDPSRFSSHAVMPVDPEPAYQLIPIMLDAPEHATWRRLLGPYFSPANINTMEDRIRSRAVGLIEELAPRGACEFMHEFASALPAWVFLELLRLPEVDLPQLRIWERLIDHPDPDNDPDRSKFLVAFGEAQSYFMNLINERRETLSGETQDLLSESLKWRIDDKPIPDDQLQSFAMMMFVAGMDTIASTLGYMFFHLATHPADRRRVVGEPQIRENAVEEMLRVYSAIQLGRRVIADTEIAGCPVKGGQMVTMPLAAANRDPKEYENPEVVDFDRDYIRHAGFGLGPHRCLGSHLARMTLRIAMDEWHRLIKDYAVRDGAELQELTGGIYGLHALPLTWTTS